MLLASFAMLAVAVHTAAEPVAAPVVVDQGDRTLTYVEITPPPLLPAPPAALPLPAVSTVEPASAKPYFDLTYTATVYVGAPTPVVTELRWHFGEREYLAYSRADFRHLAALTSLDTEAATFAFMPFVTPVTAWELPPEEQLRLRSLPVPAAGGPGFVVVTPAPAERDPAAIVAMTALHAHFAAHQAELELATLQREAAEKQRELARAAQRATPRRDQTVPYWINRRPEGQP